MCDFFRLGFFGYFFGDRYILLLRFLWDFDLLALGDNVVACRSTGKSADMIEILERIARPPGAPDDAALGRADREQLHEHLKALGYL